MRSRPVVLALSALLATGALAGCGGDETTPATGTPGAVVPTATPTVAPTPTPSPSATLDVDHALRAVHVGGQIDCLDASAGRVEVGLWTSRLQASVPLTVQDLRAIGTGVRVVGAVAVRDRKSDLHPDGVSDWPPTGMNQDFDWAARTNLKGLHLDAGEEVVPVLHLVSSGGGTLDSVEVTFSIDAGDVGSSVAVPYHATFASKGCG